jgi:hypothetical protein
MGATKRDTFAPRGSVSQAGCNPPRVCRPQTTTVPVPPCLRPACLQPSPIFIHRGARPALVVSQNGTRGCACGWSRSPRSAPGASYDRNVSKGMPPVLLVQRRPVCQPINIQADAVLKVYGLLEIGSLASIQPVVQTRQMPPADATFDRDCFVAVLLTRNLTTVAWREDQAASASGWSCAAKPSLVSWASRRLALACGVRRSK